MRQAALNRVNMWKVVYEVLQDYKSTWQDNEAFAQAVEDLKAFIDAADSAAGVQATGGTGGITTDKEGLADDAIDKTLHVTMIARAFARKMNNHTLFSAVDYNKSTLQKTPLDELEARLTGMLNAAVTVKDSLQKWGFVAGSDTAAATAIAVFSKAAPGTRVAISGRMAVTGTVPQIMTGGKNELLVMDDMIHLFDDDAPQFVATYKAARNVVDAGHRGGGKDNPGPVVG